MAITAGTLAVAAALALSISAPKKEGGTANRADETAETAAYGETIDNTINSKENAEETTSQSAAEKKARKDGEYVSEVLEPAGKEQYSQKELLLVNPWHLLPEDYEADLVSVEYGHRMDACAAEHLAKMLADCREAGYSPLVCSSYRDRAKQETLFENDVRRFMYRGYTEEEARIETAKNVAVPGSSEHEAGLAADIVYSGYQTLDESQEENETQQWLMEHCREYGFILRYPKDKKEITGITYEPWHYRYVGYEAAQEIMSRGICLEEYLGIIDVPVSDEADTGATDEETAEPDTGATDEAAAEPDTGATDEEAAEPDTGATDEAAAEPDYGTD